MRGLLTHFPEKGKTGSMSLREIDFGNLAEWVSAIAAIVTAVIVFVQIQDLRRTVQNQTSQAVYSEMLSLDRFFFQNCEFREYFYEGQEPPADKKAQARIVAELLCDLADYVCLQKKRWPPTHSRSGRHTCGFCLTKARFCRMQSSNDRHGMIVDSERKCSPFQRNPLPSREVRRKVIV